MDDLISRQAAIDAMMAEVDDKDRPNVELRWWNMGLTRASKILEQLPTAEPKTGRWIADGQKQKHGYEWMHCSVCGFSDIDDPATHTNFCPNCGAKMGGDAE